MELDSYVRDLQRQLVDSAESAGEDIREAAERLVLGLYAAARLVLLDALSAAAAEITSELAPGSVDLRLRGREVAFAVNVPESDRDDDAPDAPSAPVEIADANTSRTTIRLPDAIKQRVDDAAAADGMSVNTWMVRAIADALESKPRRSAGRSRRGDSFTGWAG